MYEKLLPAAVALWALMLSGCTDPVEACVNQKLDAYRAANPKASYAASATAGEKFRAECKARHRN